MSSGWTTITSVSTSVTLTDGNTYTLSFTDDGSQIRASIVDDNGEQALALTNSAGSSDTEVAFGWVTPSSASYTFNTPFVGVSLGA